jgi:predicted metal-dependent hydrolase
VTAATTPPALAEATARHRAVIAAAGLPADLEWTVRAKTGGKTMRATVLPGGAVEFTIPAEAPEATVAVFIARSRGRILAQAADMRERGVRIVRKALVSGEGFPFAGRNYRLRLVVDGDENRPDAHGGPLTRHPGVPVIAEPGPSTWSGIRTWQLTMRRDVAEGPDPVRAVVEWYRTAGLAWLDANMPRILTDLGMPREKWPTWTVRPYRAAKGYGGSWGTYHSRTHEIRIEWLAFQFPVELLRHVCQHEAAHAKVPGAGHGKLWQAVMSSTAPDWRELERRARELPGLPLWIGDREDPTGLVGRRPAAPCVCDLCEDHAHAEPGSACGRDMSEEMVLPGVSRCPGVYYPAP